MIYLVIPSVPPSSNNAYFNLKKGGRALSKVGQKYLAETKVHIVQHYREAIMQMRPNEPYMLMARFWLEAVENKGWPKTAESRYKKLDASNRIKLLEDALKDAVGVDDSNFQDVIIRKRQGLPERTEVWLWNSEKEESPFDEVFRSLDRR